MWICFSLLASFNLWELQLWFKVIHRSLFLYSIVIATLHSKQNHFNYFCPTWTAFQEAQGCHRWLVLCPQAGWHGPQCSWLVTPPQSGSVSYPCVPDLLPCSLVPPLGNQWGNPLVADGDLRTVQFPTGHCSSVDGGQGGRVLSQSPVDPAPLELWFRCDKEHRLALGSFVSPCNFIFKALGFCRQCMRLFFSDASRHLICFPSKHM